MEKKKENNGLYSIASARLKKVGRDLHLVEPGDKISFMWSFIESQLRVQPLQNLLDFRKRLNMIISDKYKTKK